MELSKHYVLVKEYRGKTLDIVHHGYITIVDENSKVMYHLGDPDTKVCYRSVAKPLQALPAIMLGLDKKYGLTDEETAIFSASHCGDPIHISVLESMLKKTGLSEDNFIMHPTIPARAKSNEERIRKNLPKRKLYHNCAGKHVALCTLQRELGDAIEDYHKVESLVQKECSRVIKIMGESDEANMDIGIDGCGVPVFASKMKHIAIALKNLVAPEKIKDEKLAATVEAYVPRIHHYPNIIRGEGYLCTILNADPNIFAKGGANGVYGFALKKEKIGVSFKVLDGTSKAWPLIVMEILKSFNALSPETQERLNTLNPSLVHNDNNTVVGYRELAFRL